MARPFMGEPISFTFQSKSPFSCELTMRTIKPMCAGFLHRLTIARSPGLHRSFVVLASPITVALVSLGLKYCMHIQYQSKRRPATD